MSACAAPGEFPGAHPRAIGLPGTALPPSNGPCRSRSGRTSTGTRTSGADRLPAAAGSWLLAGLEAGLQGRRGPGSTVHEEPVEHGRRLVDGVEIGHQERGRLRVAGRQQPYPPRAEGSREGAGRTHDQYRPPGLAEDVERPGVPWMRQPRRTGTGASSSGACPRRRCRRPRRRPAGPTPRPRRGRAAGHLGVREHPVRRRVQTAGYVQPLDHDRAAEVSVASVRQAHQHPRRNGACAPGLTVQRPSWPALAGQLITSGRPGPEGTRARGSPGPREPDAPADGRRDEAVRSVSDDPAQRRSGQRGTIRSQRRSGMRKGPPLRQRTSPGCARRTRCRARSHGSARPSPPGSAGRRPRPADGSSPRRC